MPAVNREIQSAVTVEVYGKLTEGGICQRQNFLCTVGRQNVQGCSFILAAYIEALIEGLVSCPDGFAAEQLKLNFQISLAHKHSA